MGSSACLGVTLITQSPNIWASLAVSWDPAPGAGYCWATDSLEGVASWEPLVAKKCLDAEHCQAEGDGVSMRARGPYFGLEIREGFPEEVLSKLSGEG